MFSSDQEETETVEWEYFVFQNIDNVVVIRKSSTSRDPRAQEVESRIEVSWSVLSSSNVEHGNGNNKVKESKRNIVVYHETTPSSHATASTSLVKITLVIFVENTKKI